MDDIDALVQQLTPEQRVRLVGEIDRLLTDDPSQDDLVWSLLQAYSVFASTGYRDAGLLLAAALAVAVDRAGGVSFARQCLAVFEAGRVFYGDDAELLALIDQLLRQEEGDGDATTSAD
jgi:hypothetical protein